MEKFTNDRDKFLKQIIKELKAFPKDPNWEPLFQYLELPYFLTYGFAYNYSFNEELQQYRLLSREWNATYDNNRFDKGIYNLNRIAIVEKIVPDEEYDLSSSTNLANLKKVEIESIVLDGLICEMNSPKLSKPLIWNVDDEMNVALQNLVFSLRDLKKFIP
ncbi:MAG: hypothetical protein DWQ02_23010 [Bacteroidetes bacterium]|nr:MAG: hypothetical protein DWQ02_23010 [Bacteroidota bacterium]